MALPTTGPLSLNDIRGELSASSSNVSLRGLSNTAGFTTPDSISEFYGYSSSITTSNIITQTATAQPNLTSANICNIYYRRTVFSVTYSSSEIQNAFNGKTSAQITELEFDVTQEPLYQPLPDYSIGMKLTTNSITSNNSGGSGGNYTLVKSQSDETFSDNTIKKFTLTSPFTWTSGNNLAIQFVWGQVQPTWNGSGSSPVGGGVSFTNWTDAAGTYTINDSAFTQRNYRPVIRLTGN